MADTSPNPQPQNNPATSATTGPGQVANGLGTNGGNAAETLSNASRLVVDPTTLVGILGAVGLMATAIALGGSPLAFLDIPAILIVLGGTTLITLASFGLKDFKSTNRVIARTMVYRLDDAVLAAKGMIQLAENARRQGLLKLQRSTLKQVERTPFLHKGLGLVIDGVAESDVEEILRIDLAATTARHGRAAGILRKAAEVAPAMGLIGTLIGLVQMLGNLDDPTAIGPAMAVALLTTFYGACLANLVLNPMANKLERNAAEEHLVQHIYLLGVLSISRQDNPRRLEMQINGILPPSRRFKVYD